MTLFVLSTVGSDRPGLTEALSAAILSANGNWLESHLSRLGGLYVGSVLVELDAADVDSLRAAVSHVDAHGLDVRVAPSLDTSGPSGETFEFSLVGQDRPGIVHQVTAVLATLEANIEKFRSWITTESQTGAPLFNVEAQLRLPADLQAATVQAALEAISAEIMVDVSPVASRAAM